MPRTRPPASCWSGEPAAADGIAQRPAACQRTVYDTPNTAVTPANAHTFSDATCSNPRNSANGKGTDFDLPWTPGWWGVTSGFVAPVNTDGFEVCERRHTRACAAILTGSTCLITVLPTTLPRFRLPCLLTFTSRHKMPPLPRASATQPLHFPITNPFPTPRSTRCPLPQACRVTAVIHAARNSPPSPFITQPLPLPFPIPRSTRCRPSQRPRAASRGPATSSRAW